MNMKNEMQNNNNLEYIPLYDMEFDIIKEYKYYFSHNNFNYVISNYKKV